MARPDVSPVSLHPPHSPLTPICRCSKCLVKTPSRIVGRANVPRKKVCASCNALICVPLMNAIALQCAPKSQLILYLELMEVPLGENVTMDELIRLGVLSCRLSLSLAPPCDLFCLLPQPYELPSFFGGSGGAPLVTPRLWLNKRWSTHF